MCLRFPKKEPKQQANDSRHSMYFCVFIVRASLFLDMVFILFSFALSRFRSLIETKRFIANVYFMSSTLYLSCTYTLVCSIAPHIYAIALYVAVCVRYFFSAFIFSIPIFISVESLKLCVVVFSLLSVSAAICVYIYMEWILIPSRSLIRSFYVSWPKPNGHTKCINNSSLLALPFARSPFLVELSFISNRNRFSVVIRCIKYVFMPFILSKYTHRRLYYFVGLICHIRYVYVHVSFRI